MKTALITTDLERGGIAVAFLNYLDSLIKIGNDIAVFVPAKSHLRRLVDARVAPGTKIFELSPLQIRAMKWGWLPLTLRAALRQCDAIISHNNFICRPLSKSGVPVIAICHSDKAKGLEWADRVIALSTGGAEALCAAGLKAEQIIRLPHYYTPVAEQNNNKTAAPLVIAAAGRFVKKKGFEDFIDAAAILAPRYQGSVEFWLAGEGELQDELRQRAQEKSAPVEFKGWMDIKTLAAQTDIFCLPSHREPFGYVLSEFMDFGVPCVATDTNGPNDILNGGAAGVVYPKGRADILAEKLAGLIESEERRKDLSEKAFSRIRGADFSKATFEKRVADLLQGLKRRLESLVIMAALPLDLLF